VVVLLTKKERNMSLNIEDARTIVFELSAMAITDGPISEEFYEEVLLRRRELLQFIDHQDQMLHGRRDPLLDDPHP
jgi:hypothetical protein